MSTSTQEMAVPEQDLAELYDLGSPKSKLVYLTLLVKEVATATELQQLLGLPKLTLLPILTSLVQQDLVSRTEGGYASR